MPLRILVITNRLPWPLNDGGNIASFHMIRQLVLHGHSVELLSLNTVKHRQDPAELKKLLPVHVVDIDTSVTPFGLVGGMFGSKPYNVQRFWSDEFATKLRSLLAEKRFDFVQLEGSYLALYAHVVKEFKDVRLVLRSHNVEFRIWERLAASEVNPLKRAYLNVLKPKIERFEKGHISEFDGIIPITLEDERWYLNQGYEGLIRTVQGGVDLSLFTPNIKDTPLRICFLGSLEWMPNRQGLEWFLENVWPELHKRFPAVLLEVAGKNPPKGYLLSGPAGVLMQGQVADAADFLRGGGIFIVPLMAGGGMRMKILEALASGHCVVSTTVGAEGIQATDGEEIILADTADEWIAKVTALLKDAELRSKLADKGRRLTEAMYGWDAIGDQVDAFYKEVFR